MKRVEDFRSTETLTDQPPVSEFQALRNGKTQTSIIISCGFYYVRLKHQQD